MAGSVSAHLTPEPERRLWLILENVRSAADSHERRVALLTAFAAAELAFLPAARGAAAACLALALPLGALALAPVERLPSWLAFLEGLSGRPSVDDRLVTPKDLAKHAFGELVLRMDRYLGGGITATPYFEDIVWQILAQARLAERRRRILAASCALVGAGQLALLVRLLP